MDIEDAAKLHILSREEARAALGLLLRGGLREVQQGLRHITDPNEQTAYLRSKVINLLVEEAAGIFLDAEQAILAGTFSGSLIHHLEPRTKAAYEACSQTAYARIYRAREVVDVELAGHRIFTALLDQLLEAQLHPDYQYSRTLLSRVSSQYEMGQSVDVRTHPEHAGLYLGDDGYLRPRPLSPHHGDESPSGLSARFFSLYLCYK